MRACVRASCEAPATLRGIGRVPPVKLPSYIPQGLKTQDAIREHRDMRFDGRTLSCPVYQREKLDVGATFSGPAVVDQLDCTCGFAHADCTGGLSRRLGPGPMPGPRARVPIRVLAPSICVRGVVVLA